MALIVPPVPLLLEARLAKVKVPMLVVNSVFQSSFLDVPAVTLMLICTAPPVLKKCLPAVTLAKVTVNVPTMVAFHAEVL